MTSPAAGRWRGFPEAVQRASSATPSVVNASRSGSVIGVACRYSMSGLRTTTSMPAAAATRDPVSCRTRRAHAYAITPKDRTEMATPDAPVR